MVRLITRANSKQTNVVLVWLSEYMILCMNTVASDQSLNMSSKAIA